MTNATDGTDPWTDRLSDYLDGELPAEEAQALERHLGRCEGCARTLEELRAVVVRAHGLEAEAPPRDLWPAIAIRLEREGAARDAKDRDGKDTPGRLSLEVRRRGERRMEPGRFTLSLPQLAAAAVALMTLSGGLAWMAGAGGPPGGGADAVGGVGAPTDATFATATDRPGPRSSTLARYQAAIAELEGVIFHGGERLDTATVRKIRESLRTIDRAIEDARRALREDPADPYVNQHLAETMRRKVELLQQTAVLAVARD